MKKKHQRLVALGHGKIKAIGIYTGTETSLKKTSISFLHLKWSSYVTGILRNYETALIEIRTNHKYPVKACFRRIFTHFDLIFPSERPLK